MNARTLVPGNLKASATPASVPRRFDAQFIEDHKLIDRYLENKLPFKGARDLENWCREHPEYLNGLKLSERAQASLKLLEASERGIRESQATMGGLGRRRHGAYERTGSAWPPPTATGGLVVLAQKAEQGAGTRGGCVRGPDNRFRSAADSPSAVASATSRLADPAWRSVAWRGRRFWLIVA